MPNVTEIRCQQACNKLNNTGLPYGWDMNIYRGCQHGCVYCYALYSHDYISKKDYYDDLYVKVNIPEQLERQLNSPSWKREEIGIGGVTDSYQPIEAKYKLMPEILKVLIKYKNPCSISTKSDLILRDYDLIDELSRVAHVSVSASINIMDEEVRKKIEPGAKSAARRFNMLKEFSKTNAFTGVLQMPVIPYISDSRENIEELYANAADCNVDYLVRGVMYLKGKTRGVFFDFIRREYPELLEKLTFLYRNYELRGAYKSSLYLMMNELKSKYRLSGNYLNPTKKQKEEDKEEGDEYKQLSLFGEVESDKIQRSIQIPAKMPFSDDQSILSNFQKKKEAKWDLNPFVEVEIGQDEAGLDETDLEEAGQRETGQKETKGNGIEQSSVRQNQVEPIQQRKIQGETIQQRINSSRRETAEKEGNQTLQNKIKPAASQWSNGDEIQVAQIKIDLDQEKRESFHAPEGQPIEYIVDEKRALLYSMRQIARENMSFYTDQAKIFYEQGMFMKDVEDDYEGIAPFEAHFPYYQRMGVEQLRTYFTWRTKVREGRIDPIPVSYGFLYIYELLNQIGVDNPGEGLKRLLVFWQEFRKIDPILDKYMFQWLKDYHIYYPVSQTFSEFAAWQHLIMNYPTVFGYGSDEEVSFELFSGISKYKIQESIFYTEENKELIHKCFHYILESFRSAFEKENKCFEDVIFYSQASPLSWSPFRRALFYPAQEQSSRQVVISVREVYTCNEEGWQYRGVMLSEQGRRLLGYILREMESSLRNVTKFKHKLTANPEVCSERNLALLTEMGIEFPETIQELVKEFYRIFTHKEVKVDVGNLQEIRKQALQTQEKLIVPEEGIHQSRLLSFTENGNREETQTKLQVEGQEESQQDVENDPWSKLITSLTTTEQEALKLIIQGQPIHSFVVEKGIMLEVLIDDINQKAMDYVGDTLLEVDDTVTIYDEYKDYLKELSPGNPPNHL